LLIEPYPYILDYGIRPSVLTASLDSSGADEKETGGIIDKPSPLYPIDEAGANEAVLFLEGTRKWLWSKSRRHHNNKGYRRIKNDQCHEEVKVIAERFFGG